MTVADQLRDGLGDRYGIDGLIGQGGMATVYRATDLKHSRLVALKVLRSELAETIGPARFLKEIQFAARLTHPHIVPLYDSGEVGGRLYYVMPYVDGESLRDLLNRIGLVDTAGAIDITRRVADALDYAHRQGVLHRDIKPENILLPDGHAVVADFGIAKALSEATGPGLTGTGIALGTPGYMSPEQASGLAAVDERTDVYSLAVVTYEMLVGQPPGHWITDSSLRAGRFVDAKPEHRLALDRLPPSMERAMARALAIRLESRFETPGDFARALADAERDRATGTEPASVSTAVAFEHQERELTKQAATRSAVALAGAPTVLAFERIIDGEVPASEYPVLIEEIRTTFGREGYHASTARSLTWTARQPERPFKPDLEGILESALSESGPQISVRVASRSGQTRVRVEQHLGEAVGGIFGGVVGGGGGGVATAVMVVGLVALSTPVAPTVIAALGALGASYGLARSIYRSVAANKAAVLEGLVDRLAEHCQDTTT